MKRIILPMAAVLVAASMAGGIANANTVASDNRAVQNYDSNTDYDSKQKAIQPGAKTYSPMNSPQRASDGTVPSIPARTDLRDAMTSKKSAQTADSSRRTSASDSGYKTAYRGGEARSASQSFLNSINSARVALATKNGAQARKNIGEAESSLAYLKSIAPEKRSYSPFQSGRVAYDSTGNYRYYPLETGPITVKSMKKGPFWSQQKGVAVTEAESVYLTLDLNDNDAEEYLANAKSHISKGEYKDADEELADLTDDIVSVDEKVAMPLDKARDNLALARHFILSQNYDGARYALKHADNALDDMEDDDAYSNRRPTIVAMREDVDYLQNVISKRDPSTLDKVDSRLEKWWNNLKSWTDRNT